MITNNNAEAYIELLKARITELEADENACPEFPHIQADLFNLRKELLSVRDTAECNSQHLNALKQDSLWKKASQSYQSSYIKLMARLAYATENQAGAMHSIAAAIRETRGPSARELMAKHGFILPSEEQQEVNLYNNTGLGDSAEEKEP